MSGCDHPVLEVRNTQGYGMRWIVQGGRVHVKEGGVNSTGTGRGSNRDSDSNGIGGYGYDCGSDFGSGYEVIFRGFLEPMMKNGHALGWKHL